MMRNTIFIRLAVLVLMLLMITKLTEAQQIGRYSLYMQNFYAINPAAAGLENHIDATLGYRQQWVGLANSPQNYFVSANMPIKKEYRSPQNSSLRISDPELYNTELPVQRKSKSGIGMMVNVNQYGAFKYTQAYGTYSFHLPITKKLNLSFGANIGINSYSIDKNLIQLEIPADSYYDEVIADAQANSTLLDMDVGFMLYSKRWFVGYSTEQLLGNNISFGSGANFGDLLVHHRLLVGRKFKLNRNLKVMPNGFIYATKNGILSTEINVRVDFRDQFWGGISYRYKDAIIPMLGLYINDQIKIGYAYDLNVSPIRKYAPGGSHEFMLGVMFGNKRVIF